MLNGDGCRMQEISLYIFLKLHGDSPSYVTRWEAGVTVPVIPYTVEAICRVSWRKWV